MGRLDANEAINQKTSVQIRLDETSGVWSPTQDRVNQPQAGPGCSGVCPGGA